MQTLRISSRLLAKLLKHAPTELLADVLVRDGVTCLIEEVGEKEGVRE